MTSSPVDPNPNVDPNPTLQETLYRWTQKDRQIFQNVDVNVLQLRLNKKRITVRVCGDPWSIRKICQTKWSRSGALKSYQNGRLVVGGLRFWTPPAESGTFFWRLSSHDFLIAENKKECSFSIPYRKKFKRNLRFQSLIAENLKGIFIFNHLSQKMKKESPFSLPYRRIIKKCIFPPYR